MYVKLLPYKPKVWTLPSSENWMLFLPWDIVNIRKLKRNIVTSPSPICPCCMLNEKENSLSIIVIRTKRPRFIAFTLTQWFSSLCRSRSFKISVHKLPLPPPMASSAQLLLTDKPRWQEPDQGDVDNPRDFWKQFQPRICTFIYLFELFLGVCL